jgi:hypothetical protein
MKEDSCTDKLSYTHPRSRDEMGPDGLSWPNEIPGRFEIYQVSLLLKLPHGENRQNPQSEIKTVGSLQRG